MAQAVENPNLTRYSTEWWKDILANNPELKQEFLNILTTNLDGHAALKQPMEKREIESIFRDVIGKYGLGTQNTEYANAQFDSFIGGIYGQTNTIYDTYSQFQNKQQAGAVLGSTVAQAIDGFTQGKPALTQDQVLNYFSGTGAKLYVDSPLNTQQGATPQPGILNPQNTGGLSGTRPDGTVVGTPGVTGTTPITSGTPGATTPGQPTSTNPPVGTQSSQSPGLPPELQDLKNQLQNFLTELQRRGQVLNPNVEITPQKLAEFLKQAENEIAPYYANLLKTSRDTLYRGLGYSANEIQLQEQQLERQYGTRLRQTGESAAEQGFALSGLRQRDERDLATDTQQTIDANRRQLNFNATNAAADFAQQFGTSNLPTLNIGAAPTVTPGQYGFGTSTRSLPLYTLSNEVYSGLKGTKQFEETAAIQARASELESAERQKQAIAQQRQLIL